MRSKFRTLTDILAVAAFTAILATQLTPIYARGEGNPNPSPVVWVTSQGLFYDSTVTTPLPPYGPFQKLIMGESPSGLSTEFGPGDPGYVGGRWWVDLNGNNVQDYDDMYFSCPLQGPGREEL